MKKEFYKEIKHHYIYAIMDLIEECVFVGKTCAKDPRSKYSASYLKLLLTIGSEIDVMLEFLANLYDPDTKERGFGCSIPVYSVHFFWQTQY